MGKTKRDTEERGPTGLRDGDTFPRTWGEEQEWGRGAGRQFTYSVSVLDTPSVKGDGRTSGKTV